MKKSRIYTLLLSILAICCVVSIWLYYAIYKSPVVTQPDGYVYYLKPGTSKQAMINELTEAGLIQHPVLFALYVYPQAVVHLKTGEYRFPMGATPASMWKQMINGSGFVQHKFTIIPGWTFKQLRLALKNADALHHVIENMDDKQIMTALGHAELAPEGEFFPDTYHYTKGVSDQVILERAFALMQSRLNAAWEKRAANLPYQNAYEALIAASLVEKEAFLSSERPIIAGVIVNRLNKNMLLQIDPTVIYGIGDRYDGKIYKTDLREDTPYNTYVRKGLPPTPIAMPSMASIDAVMHPQVHQFYYFVAKGGGAHQFSENLSEHNTAVTTAAEKQARYFNEDAIKNYLRQFWNEKKLTTEFSAVEKASISMMRHTMSIWR